MISKSLFAIGLVTLLVFVILPNDVTSVGRSRSRTVGTLSGEVGTGTGGGQISVPSVIDLSRCPPVSQCDHGNHDRDVFIEYCQLIVKVCVQVYDLNVYLFGCGGFAWQVVVIIGYAINLVILLFKVFLEYCAY